VRERIFNCKKVRFVINLGIIKEGELLGKKKHKKKIYIDLKIVHIH